MDWKKYDTNRRFLSALVLCHFAIVCYAVSFKVYARTPTRMKNDQASSIHIVAHNVGHNVRHKAGQNAGHKARRNDRQNVESNERAQLQSESASRLTTYAND